MLLLLLRLMEIGMVINYPLGFVPFFRDRSKTRFPMYLAIIGLLLIIVTSIDSFHIFPKLVRLYGDYNSSPNPPLMISFFVIQYLIGVLLLFIGLKLKKFTLKNNRNLYVIHTIATIALLIWLELAVQTVVVPISGLVELAQ